MSNYYGQPVVPPELYDGEHVAVVPAAGGLPPVCSCGWTRHEVEGRMFELADHLTDMAGFRQDQRQRRRRWHEGTKPGVLS